MRSIGLDIIEIARIDKGIKRFEDKYLKKILGPEEISLLKSRRDRAQFVAGRFAAKEALIKALGAFIKKRPPFPELQVVYNRDNLPVFSLPAYLSDQLDGHAIMLSITHEKKMAAAVVVISEDS